MNIVARLASAEPAAPPDADAVRRPGWPRRPGVFAPGLRGLIVRFMVAAAWLTLVTRSWFGHAQDVAIGYLSVAIVVCAVAFAIAIPVVWLLAHARRIWAVLGFLLVQFLLWPALGWDVVLTWVLVAVVLGHAMFSTRVTALLALGLALLATAFQFAGQGWPGATIWLPDAPIGSQPSSGVIWLPAVIASVTLMISGFSRQRAAIVELRATQHELARLAVEEERGRLARDIHDILGHSLTAITVKTELTGMLIDADRASEARHEVSAVEELARGALADVRSTVAGFRGVTVAGELANARAMLESAGIDAELPTTVDELPARLHELAGWVIREGVTNVVRHSDAERCRITIGVDGVEVADDGCGPGAGGRGAGNGGPHASDSGDPYGAATGDGNGLRGLRERAGALGCTVSVGRSDLGGFSLRLSEGPNHG